MKQKILMILVMLLSLPTVYAYNQDTPAAYNIRYQMSTDLSFTVTLPLGQTEMIFASSPGTSSADPIGQTDTAPWAKINNTGDISRNFTMGLGSNNPLNIVLRESNVYDMTGSIILEKNPQILLGGQNLAPDTELSVFVKGNFSSVPVGTNGTFNNTATIRNYLPVLQSISVSYTPTGTIYEGDTRTFIATGIDQYGKSIPISPAWASSNTAVGTIDTNGKFTAIVAGSTNITATSGSLVGYKVVTVQAGY